jgi:outer membrane protein OmpA-like peptidoglycan-associated protein
MTLRKTLALIPVFCSCGILAAMSAGSAEDKAATALAAALMGLPEDEECLKDDKCTRGIGVAAKPSTLTLNVQFKFNSSTLQEQASGQLDLLRAALLRDQIRGKGVEISGHTDSRGNAGYNLALSARRAESVRAYLLAKDGDPDGNQLDANHLIAVGRGEEQPLDPANPEGARNRRVEVRLIAVPGK